MSSNVSFPSNDLATLNKDQWLQIAAELLEAGPYLQAALERLVQSMPEASEVCPALDPIAFEGDIRAACAAISYVAEYAADKCQFIVVKEE